MKDTFIWYVNVPFSAGHQSNRVATIAILRGFVLSNGLPYYRVGVAVKNPKDGLPFIKKEGRAIAIARARESEPVFTIHEAGDKAVKLLLGGVRDPKVLCMLHVNDCDHLRNRVERVLGKFSQTLQ
jgi:hypothetical protein